MRRVHRVLRCFRHGFGRADQVLARVRALPDGSADALLAGAPALILSPHPDDESLGCGGLIASAPRAIHLAIVTDGAGLPGAAPTLAARRQAETLAATGSLGLPASHVHFWNVRDGAAPHSGRAARLLADKAAALATQLGARTILTTWNYDPHPDHVATYRYAQQAARQLGTALFAYPVWAWMLPGRTLLPNLHPAGVNLRLGSLIERKRHAVQQHRSQVAALQDDTDRAFGLTEQHVAAMVTGAEPFIACNAAARERLRQPVRS